MNRVEKIKALLIGLFVYFLNKLIQVDKKTIIFGGGNGNYYSDNSKYLFEYYLENSAKTCWWITRNNQVYKRLKEENKPVLKNNSFRGIWQICKAQTIIFCTSRIDVMYVYLKADREIVNLFHAMPLKKVIYDYDGKDQRRGHLFDRLWNKYVAGFKWEDSDITLSSSEYFKSVICSAFKVDNVAVTGLPRNDYFFSEEDAMSEKFLDIQMHKEIISYLPTHRNFGSGKQPETPFLEDSEFQQVLVNYNTVLVHKPHYNVLKEEYLRTDALIEFAPGEVDVQEMLKFSKVLITDYSSCYIDFLLLDRPVIFYRYDNYAQDDTGLYDKIEDLTEKIGPVCRNADELKVELKKLLAGNDDYKQSRSEVKKILHKDLYGGYNQKLFNIIEHAE